MTQRNESYTPLLCSYPDSEKVNKVSEGAEAMFCRLLAKCDDAGNYDGQPKRLLCKLYALRYENGTMTERRVRRYRDELVTARLVDVYLVDGVEYVHIRDCKKSLRSDVKAKLYFPEYSQSLANKELPEDVTKTGRKRNVSVTGTKHQSNPIQSNPKQEKALFLDFVSLSKEEYSKLVKKYGEPQTKSLIKSLNDGIGSKGYKYKSHYHTILVWAKRDNIPILPTKEDAEKDEIAALEKKRQEMRAEHGQFIREADEKKLITVWRTQITLRPLIRELRPEIAGKAK